jgi:signal transduction histidine kinase
MILGAALTVESYEYFVEEGIADPNMVSIEIKIIYLLLLLSSILIIFFKPRQEQHELLDAQKTHLGERVNDKEEELQKLVALKNEFLRNLNHELRTPVTGITSMAQALLANGKNLTNEELMDSIKIIAQSSDRFENYTNSLLDLSKLSSLNFELHKTTINLSNLLYDRLEACIKMYLDSKPLEFVTDIELDIAMSCDKHYMQLVFDNLIINAINYSDKGKVFVSLKKTGAGIVFSIQDEGVGIARAELFSIFEAFTVSSKTYTPAGGRGVGLAICQKSIEAHGGTIWAESDGKKGAMFKFEIEFPKD